MFEGLFQPLHLVVILVIVMVVFGPGKLPELGQGLGKGIRDFKKALHEGETDFKALHEGEASTDREKLEHK
ncbi:MAG: twin-arginine translocase TatA/TatE family subunit [Desulfobacteraceae bacterium]|nr:twin-arginine translocase TatA/TatE family subunit [Desulfobacteraceae bacterium]